VEVYKQSQEAKKSDDRRNEELKQTNAMLSQISRTLYPLKDLRIGSYYEISLEHPLLKPFYYRLEKGVRAALVKEQNANFRSVIPATRGVLVQTKPDGAYIKSLAALYPSKVRDKLVWNLIDSLGIRIDIYKQPVDLNQLNEFTLRPVRTSDLVLFGKVDSPNIWYDLGRNAIVVDGQMKVSAGRTLSGNATIASMLDLAGTQALISFTYNDTATSDTVGRLVGIEKKCRINILVVQIGDFSIPLDLKEVQTGRGVLYVSTFPDSLLDGPTR
jgi:hypothetical protein